MGKLFAAVALLTVSSLALGQGQKQNAPAHNAPPPAAHNAPQGGPKSPAQGNMQRGPSAGTMAHPNTGSGNASGGYGNRGPNAAGANAGRSSTGSKDIYSGYGTRGPNTGGAGGATAGRTGSKDIYGGYGTRGATGANATQGTNATGGLKAGRGTNTGGLNTKGGTTNVRGTTAAGGANARTANMARGTTNAAGAGKMSPKGTTTRQFTTHSGAKVTASFRGNNVRSIQAHNMHINHGLHGGRHIVSERNGLRVVGFGHGRGYAQRAYFRRGGRAYYQRTYWMGGRRYAYAYRGYYWHGYRYYGYAPAYYYRPVYYGWAYNPWPAPVYYNWGWGGNPWYGYYNYYYAPYPFYPAAPFWLTDYMMAQQLQAAYEAGLAARGEASPPSLLPAPDLMAGLWSEDLLVSNNLQAAYGAALYAAPAGSGGQPLLSKEVKDALAEEIKQQIAADKAAAANPNAAASSSGGDELPPAFAPNFRYYVVASDLDVTTNEGQECALTQGDVIQRTSDTIGSDNNVAITIRASKKDDCAVGTNAAMSADDLQEMYNHFRETLDAGLKALAEKSGKGGLPAAPDTGTTAGEVPPPTPDANVESDLQQQEKDADQTEAEVRQGAGG